MCFHGLATPVYPSTFVHIVLINHYEVKTIHQLTDETGLFGQIKVEWQKEKGEKAWNSSDLKLLMWQTLVNKW